jgi:hypothetical protein
MKTTLVLVALSFLTVFSEANALEVNKTVASFNITPCSRATTYKDSFGITWPTIQFADQSVDLIVKVSGNDQISLGDIEETIFACDQFAIGVGLTVGAFSANPGAFAGAYEVSFNTCAVARLAGDLTGVSVKAENRCHW